MSFIPSNVQKDTVIKINSFLQHSVKTEIQVQEENILEYFSSQTACENHLPRPTVCGGRQLRRDALSKRSATPTSGAPATLAAQQRHSLPSDTFP